MNDKKRKNLFKLEEDEFEMIEAPKNILIEDMRKEETIKIYPEKKVKTKRNKIKVSSNTKNFNEREEYLDNGFSQRDNLNISAEEYPGQVVKHKNNYFISMLNDKNFEWFLLK